jgi:hypothetical protein
MKQRAKRLVRCPLMMQEAKSPEGFQMTICQFPRGGQVLFLGSSPPEDNIFVYCLIADKLDEQGNPRPLQENEFELREFVVAIPGHLVPDSYKFRATVRTQDGIMFLFETESANRIILPGGRG